MTQITYVTSYMKIYNTPFYNRDDAYFLSKFNEIVKTGIRICVYTDNIALFKDYDAEYVKVFETRLINTWVYQTVKQLGGVDNDKERNTILLPPIRTTEKDTTKYMILMNSKIDFIKDAIDKNPFDTSHYAWIDFGITYIFKNLVECQKLIRLYNSLQLEAKFLCIPGCLGKTPITDINAYINHVNWRFCGGFFVGDKESIQQFHTLHRNFFPQFLKENNTLVWEVNFWAWLEFIVSDWNPTWYPADHNDSIINIPTKFYAISLKTACCGKGDNKKEGYKRFTYDYPKIDGFTPSSASHFSLLNQKTGDKKHFLNTRYVNYTIITDGWYMFHHPEQKIISRNMVSILDPETMVPTCYVDVNEDETGIERKMGGWIEGMEDIRIFQRKNKPPVGGVTTLEFIATSVNYSNNNNNRMIIGNYEIDENAGRCSLKKCRVLSSPYEDADCEKNWIPVGEEGSFIYKWSPLEIISLANGMENQSGWTKTTTNQTEAPICKKFRGSTVFVDSMEGGDEFLGIVHFTEGEGGDKCYFHCFVAINKKTMKPNRYSQPFYFENKGIEYCIGFYIRHMELTQEGGGVCKNGNKDEGGGKHDGEYLNKPATNNLGVLKYYFWISQMDRDPLMIVTDVPDIRWLKFE